MIDDQPNHRRRTRVSWAVGMLLAVLAFLGLSIPFPGAPVPRIDTPTPFRWDAAELFTALEGLFAEAQALDDEEARRRAVAEDLSTRPLLARIEASASTPTAELDSLATTQFRYATLAAAHPALLPALEDRIVRTRVAVMRAASSWPQDRATHEALYRVIYGGRLAVEEALVQAGTSAAPELVRIEDIPSATPSLEIGGVRIHSGDILLSRGGAPTSALIARGSDFANTFSHVALAHVDEETGAGTVLESLIETGSVLSSVDEYLASKKFKILVLRLRPDHPALVGDPLLPHRAATAMLQRLQSGRVPYDFAMEWSDDERMFCSEVIHHAFVGEGVDLWSIRSDMTAPGLVRWLSAMGVRQFRTLVPSDLEYDAALRAVAEWRDQASLLDYRRDNAITDVLLTEADRGADLGYPWWKLPFGRVAKGVSWMQHALGRESIIPQGMSVDAALRVSSLVSTVNPTVKAELVERERRFIEAEGYAPPYWTLVELAGEAVEAVRPELGKALD